MALYRKLTQYISEFYKNSNKVLLLTGARQTGKTYAARQLGNSFKSFIEINFIEHPEAVDIFKNVYSSDEILLRISALTSSAMIPGETLIFFDEVQRCENIVTAVKFLVEDGRFRYILSGSLLGVEMKGINSHPVGFMGIKEVFPLDFEEFIINLNVSQSVRANIKQCWTERKAVDQLIHEKMLQLFRLYSVIGGMPAAVSEYMETNNLSNVLAVQQDIVSLYRMDIAQYAERDKLKIKEIFDLIPSELDAKNKRFILKNLNEHAKMNRYEDSFLWLKDAGVAIPVYNVEEPKAPLKLAETRNLFKLFSNDVGLLAAQYASGIQLKLIMGDSSINFGAIYENVVAEELLTHEITPYYYNNKKRGEIDFVVSINSEIVPIEVKSGKDYQRHSALNNLISDSPYDFKEALILCNGNIEIIGKLLYAPIYMVMYLQNNDSGIGIYRPDLTGLL
ncbi:MAG: ATP-binding protein [Duncaniella sp.]|nr:ATP-binding protein [Duncaniella sp.]